MKKTFKLFLSLFVMTAMFLGLYTSVKAEDVQVKNTEFIQHIRSLNYNEDTRMYALATTDGRIVFCLNSSAIAPGENNTPSPQTYYYVGDNGISTDISSKAPAIISIINDYSNSSIMIKNDGSQMSNREKFFVTQYTLWNYIEGTSGLITQNGVNWIKSSRFSNAYNTLMSRANNAAKNGIKNPKISITSYSGGALSAEMAPKQGTSLMLSKTSFGVSFTQTSNDKQDFKVSLSASSGVKSYLTDNDGNANYGTEHTFKAGQRFKIAIDTAGSSNGVKEATVTFNVSGTTQETKDQLKVYAAYNKGNKGESFQDVAMVTTSNVPLSTGFSVKTDISKNYDLEIVKVNSKNEKIAGAVIGIYTSEGNKVNEVTSTTSPEKVSLPAGKYYIQEISAPEGYLLSDQKVNFSIDNDGKVMDANGNVISTKSITLVNTLPVIKIEKVNEKKIPVKGAEIVICDYDDTTKKESNCNYKWTTDGTVKELTIGVDFGSIKNGSYVIKELSAPHGFELSEPKYITVRDGRIYGDLQNSTVTIVDVSYLDVSKTDATGQDEIAGANMKLYDKNGNLVEEWVSETKEHRIKGLNTGEMYEIVETLAPEGYVPLSTSIHFVLNEDGSVTTCNVKMDSNNNKTCEAMSSDEILKIKNDVTKIKISKVDITNQQELPGATLRILNTDGSPVYQNGEILEWVSSNEPHYIEMLPVGKYKLVETVVPEGYVAVTNEIEFEVKAETGIQTVVFENDTTKVLISKKDFTTGKEIPGATLQILNTDGSPVYQNGEKLEWVSGEEPHYIERLPIGKYILVETLPADGYKEGMIVDGMLTSKYEFEVKDNNLLKIDVYNEVMDVPITGLDVSSTYVMGSMIVLAGLGTITIAHKKREI